MGGLRDSGSEPRDRRVPTEGTACGEPFSISEHSMVEDLYEVSETESERHKRSMYEMTMRREVGTRPSRAL